MKSSCRLSTAACLASISCLTISSVLALVHPGISHSQTDLDRMKNNSNVEPYKTALAQFSSQGYSSSTNTGQGPYVSVTYGQGQFQIRNDAQIAHQNAVMWYVTGNTAYRTNAINILNGWKNTMTSFDQSDLLTAGTAVLDFCNAAEILRSTGGGAWSATDITQFQNWLLQHFYPVLLSPGGSIQADVLGPAGFGGLQIKGLLSLGVFCDRQDIYNFGVSSYLHNGNYSYGLLEYISPSGQNYENQRDVGHPSGNLGAFMESGYIIWNQGQDVFGTAGNLLAKAYESQAKFDLGWDVAPIPYTTKDGGFRSKMSGENRTPVDNLLSDLAYRIFHDIKGLEMPYTKMSADYKFQNGQIHTFYHRVDNTGTVPTRPLVGNGAPTGVGLYEDYFSGSYITHFAPGNYTNAQLRSGGMHANNSGAVSSMKVPVGWTVTAYDRDNFTGNSVVATGTLQNKGMVNLGDMGFNDRLVSMKVVGGGTCPVFNSTYKIVNRASGKTLAVNGSSTANGAGIVQTTYTGASNQLWRVEDLGFNNGQYKITNLNSGKVLEIAAASVADGASASQWESWETSSANLAAGGTPNGSALGSTGEQPPQAFDKSIFTKWCIGSSSGWLQYQLPAAVKVTQYRITSANDVPQRDPKNWQLLGSNDGNSWIPLDTKSNQTFSGRYVTNTYNITNNTAYSYYRLNVTANAGGTGSGLQFSEMGLFSNLLTLASGGTPGASATTSPGEQATQAFDGDVSTKWTVAGSSVWLQYQLPTATTVMSYRITSANDVPQRDPKNWNFQGSTNGTSWTNLDTQTNQVFQNRFETKVYNLNTTGSYTYYRLNITANSGGASFGTQLAELGLYSFLTGANSQRWTFTAAPGSSYGSYFTIKNVNSSKVLEVPGSSTSDGTGMVQRTAGSGNNQQWSLMVP